MGNLINIKVFLFQSLVQSKITEIFFQLTLVAGGGNDPTVQNLAILILSWENVSWLIAVIDEHVKEKHI